MKRVILIVIVLLVGICLISYPFVSNYLIELDGSRAIQEFNTQLEDQSAEQSAQDRKLAQDYNAALTGSALTDPFVPGSGYAQPQNYDEILNYSNHMMGYIEIPTIDVYLPIYHGTSEETLAKGIGHMSQTAFPIGGLGNHSVLTGHSALAEAKLFSDLDKLVRGDKFFIHILGQTLAYQVGQIDIVLPEETQGMLPQAGKDYVTLVTCTPYAVNTHRLLVRGEQVPFVQSEYETATEQGAQGMSFAGVDTRAVLIGLAAAVVIVGAVNVVLFVRRKKKQVALAPIVRYVSSDKYEELP